MLQKVKGIKRVYENDDKIQISDIAYLEENEQKNMYLKIKKLEIEIYGFIFR